MKLSEELKFRGLNKSKLADLLEVSRQTVHRMGENVSDAVLAILKEIPVKTDMPWDLPDDEFREIIRNRSSTTDGEICEARGWQVWEFNQAIADWVKRNPYKRSDASPENGYDLSKYVKGGIADFNPDLKSPIGKKMGELT